MEEKKKVRINDYSIHVNTDTFEAWYWLDGKWIFMGILTTMLVNKKGDEVENCQCKLPKQMVDLDESVLKLKFSQVRSKCLLQNANITTIRELVNFTEDEFLKIGNCGMITFKDIKETMWRYGIRFRDEDDAKNSRSTN